MNKKGFTVVELMTTFVLVAVISTLLVKLVITLKEIYISGDMKTTLITKQSTMTDKIYKDLKEKDLTKIESCGENVTNCIKFVFAEGTKTLIIDKTEKTLKYDNYTIKLDRGGYFGDVTINKYNSDIGSILHYSVPIYNKILKGDYGINITYQINNNVEFDNDIVFDVKDTGVTVTLDPNGGTVSQTTKQVTVGDTYGKLPVPEREGYVFKGWNGKNLADTSESIDAIKNEKEVKLWVDTVLNNKSIINNLMPNKEYTLSYDVECTQVPQYDSKQSSNVGFYFYSGVASYTSRWTLKQKYLNVGDKEHHTSTFITPSYLYETAANYRFVGYTNRYLKDNKGVYSTMIFKNIQLEEGDTATAYEPYYIQSNTKVVQNKNHTLKAIWEKKEATFMVGRDFNAKIKKLAGDTNGAFNTENTTITSIKRYNKKPSKSILNNAEVVSTNDSKYPIYAWFDNGTIYYYTEALNPYMNSNAQDMFQYLTKAKTIDVNTFDTSKVTNMQGLFNLDASLETLDLSNFDTSNITNMHASFQYCSKITSLDLSEFDMSNVTYSPGSLIKGMSSLVTLKTPKIYPTDSSVTISLPGTFKDGSNNTYTSLNNSSPKSTTLTKQ